MPLPKLVIVGRPNVGKSSLLNMLAGRTVSIVEPTAGVTRDRVATQASLPPKNRGDEPHLIEVIDTGGYGIEDTANLTADVERQIALGVAQADVVMFVIDAQSGVVTLDQRVARMLRQSNPRTPILMVANKVDSKAHEATAFEATRLGMGEPILVSAMSGYNKRELFDAIIDAIDWSAADREPEPTGMLLAIVGKRNAGKSTLVNALANEHRVIVSEVEGTTRDSVDVRFEIDGHVFTAIDTAGVRKTKSLADDIEYYSHHRALRSIRRADVVLFLIDATVEISQVDKQLGHEILKHHKPVAIVVNKWDQARQRSTEEDYADYLEKELKGLDFAPIVFTTAKTGDGVRDAAAMALNLYEQAGERLSTSQLNQVMEQIVAEHPPTSKIGRRLKIYYATQLAVHPPTIGLFVNDPSLFDPTYQRYLIHRYRELLPYSEVPIKLVIRGRTSAPGEDRSDRPRRKKATAAKSRPRKKR
jgi:GTP-binding protein